MKKTLLSLLLISAITLIFISFYKSMSNNNSQNFLPKEKLTRVVEIEETEADSKVNNISQDLSKPLERFTDKTTLIIEAGKKNAQYRIDKLKKRSFYYPDTPSEAYLKHINLSNQGDYESQYVIYNIIRDCDLISKPDTSIFKNNSISKNSPREIVRDTYNNLHSEYCYPLQEKIAISAKAYKNLESFLLNAGHPVFLAKELINFKDTNYSQTPLTEHKLKLRNALEVDSVGSFMIINSYLTSNQPHLRLEREAWRHLACQYGRTIVPCQSSTKSKWFENMGYTTNEVTEILKLADSYKKDIDNKQWDRLLNDF